MSLSKIITNTINNQFKGDVKKMAKENQEQQQYLEQTEGSFKLRGLVKRIDNDKAYNVGKVKSGKNQGKNYRSIRFGIQTSPTNELPVELFGMETDTVYVWNADKKEGQKEKWGSQYNLGESETLLGQVVRVGLTTDSDGKFQSHNLTAYDSVDEIFNNLENGDSVAVTGHIEFSEYTKDDGTVVPQTKFIIDNISRTKEPVDFEAEGFVEVNDFTQQVVILDKDLDRKKKELNLFVRTIGYQNRFSDGTFVVDGNTEEGAKLGSAFSKLKFGTFLEVFGKMENRVVLTEVEVEEEKKPKIDKSNPFADFTFEKPKSLESYKAKSYINRLLITGVEASSFVDKKYKEEDFFVEELVDDKTKAEDNPFTNGDLEEDKVEDVWA